MGREYSVDGEYTEFLSVERAAFGKPGAYPFADPAAFYHFLRHDNCAHALYKPFERVRIERLEPFQNYQPCPRAGGSRPGAGLGYPSVCDKRRFRRGRSGVGICDIAACACERGAGKIRFAAAGVAYHHRAVRGKRFVEAFLQSGKCRGGIYCHARDGCGFGNVKNAVVGGAVVPDNARAVEREYHMEPLQCRIVDKLIVSTLHEG